MKVLALVAGMLALGAAQADAATVWSGETHGSVHRSNRLASGGHSWDGTFRFSVGAGGDVHGYAVVAYTPELDMSGTDNALGFIRDVVPAAFGLLGPLEGAAANAGLTSIIGFDVAFKQGTAIRRGRLSGHMANGRITLNWPKARGIPYDVKMVLPGSEQKVSAGRATLHNPFRGAGQVVSPGLAVHASQPGSAADSSGVYWAAQRVG
jgi:hypothetical protein